MNLSSEQIAAPVETASRLRRSPLGWILAVMVALGWHVFWGCWLDSPEPVSKASLSRLPWVSFMPIPSDNWALWSPSAFSLPSSMGFSHAALTNGTGARPPLQVPGGASIFLDRRVVAKLESSFPFTPDFDQSVEKALANLPDCLSESPAFGSIRSTGIVVQVEWSSGSKGTLLMTKLPSDDLLLKDKPWEVIAFVEFNAEGKVRAVFLETKSSFQDVDSALIRALWRWQMKDASEPLNGRVTFRSPGRRSTGGEPQSAGAL